MKKESFHSRNLDLLRSLSLVSSFSSSFFVLVALCLRLIEERRRGEKNHDKPREKREKPSSTVAVGREEHRSWYYAPTFS